MPKLNAVAMVVLTLAVIAGAGALVLHKAPTGAADQGELQKLFRNLTDRDPDVRHEAEAGILSMGPKALASLNDAVKSADPVLVERAKDLLVRLQPAPARVVKAPESPVAEAPSKAEIMEFVLESRGGQARAADLAALWVQFRNNGPSPLLVAHAPTLDHPKMAVFEVEDEKGARREVQAEILHHLPADLRVLVAVRPHETEILFQGGKRLAEAVSKPGTYRIRFAYDATEGSEYRKGVKASADGALLPPVRLLSNTVTVTVTN